MPTGEIAEKLGKPAGHQLTRISNQDQNDPKPYVAGPSVD